MRVTSSFEGRRRVVDVMKEDVIVGRAADGYTPDLDLGDDTAVSRRHARIWWRDGHYWVQDLGSTYGTFVNGIANDYKRQLKPGDKLRIGETHLAVEPSPEEPPTVRSFQDEAPTAKETGEPGAPAASTPQVPRSDVEISTVLNADESFSTPRKAEGTEFHHRFALLVDLPLEFAAETRIESLLQLVVERLIKLIPGVRRGALLLSDPRHDRLVLKAHHPPGEASVSETLARRALASRTGFIWRSDEAGRDSSASIRRLQITAGMYVPLLWKGRAVGVLCVDNAGQDTEFQEADLRFALSIAHYAAAAVANQQLQEELQTKSTVLERLLTQFSPRLRATLLDKAIAGKLRPGGEKSEVTVLFSDIRGFTATSASMDAQEVMDMLNDYFPPLVQAIFAQDGTIDKFVGDAILAVFGSPEPDARQHEKAVLAALGMQAAMRSVNARRRERGEVICEIGIGIHCGEVLHGFIGAAERLEFTVIGDTVNKTSRYCSGAKGGEILLSQTVFEHAYHVMQADKTTIPTKHEGELTAYRVKGTR
jgi:adenylate cyclase